MGSEFNFQKLTPFDKIENLGFYEDALDFALNEKDIKNIAITGIYGAGKSSVLESYKNLKFQDKKIKKGDYIHISLANYKSASVNTDFKTKESNSNFEDIDNKTLEGKILNQLLHQIDAKNIPQSIFRLKQNPTKTEIWCPTIFILAFAINFFYLWKYSSPDFSYFQIVLILILAIQLILLIFNLVKLQLNRNFLKGLSIRSGNIQGNIEIFEDTSESYFDKYLDDVVYLFYNSGAKVIVFEDIDRFDNHTIFARLKELNLLVNNKKEKNLQDKVSFIYMVKDDMFLSKDRTKFFDFILPIIPFANSNNTYDLLKEILEKTKRSTDNNPLFELLDSNFLLKTSIYIDDMRLLKNIVNEFVAYNEKLTQLNLNINNLFAIIVYKNIFPNDFSKLQLNSGFIFQLFEHKEDIILKKKESIQQEINQLNDRIEESNREILNSKYELFALYFNNKENYHNLEVDGKVEADYPNRGSFIEAIFNTDFKVRENKYNTYRHEEVDLSDEFAEISKNPLVEKRLKAIEDKNREAEIKQRINNLEYKKDGFSELNLYQVITREDLESIKDKNEVEAYVDIKESSHFDLLTYFITNGYIDEEYYNYISYFFPNSLTVSDQEFLRGIYGGRQFKDNFNLTNLSEIYNRLETQDFLKIGTLNLDLFKYILSNDGLRNRDIVLKNYFKQFIRLNNVNFFIQSYIRLKNEDESVANILLLLTIDYEPGLVKKIIQDSLIPKVQKNKFVIDILKFYQESHLQVLGKDKDIIINYINDTYSLLFPNVKYNNQLMNNLKFLNVNIEQIDFNNLDSKLGNYIYENDLYALNMHNIKSILLSFYQYKDDWRINHQNYSLITDLQDKPIKERIENNIELYIEEYLEFSSGEILDDDNSIYSILNNQSIDLEIKKKYLKSLSNQELMVNYIEDEELYIQLINQRNLKLNSQNILRYFKFFENKWSEELLYFVNISDNNFKFKWPKDDETFNEEFKEIFFNVTVLEDDLEINIYESIMEEIAYSLPKISDIEKISNIKIKILIKLEIIKFTKENLIYFRKNKAEILMNFIANNLDAYLELVNGTTINDKDEILNVLDYHSNSAMNIKKKIINVVDGSVSIHDRNFSPRVLNHVLKMKFEISDLTYLIANYDKYSKSTQSEIYSNIIKYLNFVKDNKLDLPELILKKLVEEEKIPLMDRQLLLSRNIRMIKSKDLNNIFETLELNDFIDVINNQRRNKKFDVTEINSNILKDLKVMELISSFKEEGDYFKVNSKRNLNLN